MSWQVYKFGGSSLGSPGRLSQVIELVRAVEGPLAVVVSALGDTTDWLIAAARQAASGSIEEALAQVAQVEALSRATAASVFDVAHQARAADDFENDLQLVLIPIRKWLEGISLTRECTPRALDEVMSAGERISIALVSRALRAAGVPAVAVDARELVVTDDTAQNANVDVSESGQRIRARLESLQVERPIITGFLGRSRQGWTTTLGRNGSDYSASLVAQALGAHQVTVWTDVPGVFTADPALVSEAYPVAKLTYAEAVELAHFGTRMFHARTMIPLLESGAVLRIRSTANPDAQGTTVDAIGDTRADRPTSVTSLEQLALISVEARRSSLPAGLVAAALRALEAAGIKVWMANQTGLGVSASFVVSLHDGERAHALLVALGGNEVSVGSLHAPVTLVTLVAERMGHHPNVAGRFFHSLGTVGINVRAIAQGGSQRSVSCVVDASDTASAVRTVHAAFNFAEVEVHAVVLGHGTVGSKLLAQFAALNQSPRAKHGVRLKLVGLLDSHRAAFDAGGLDPELAVRSLRDGHSFDQVLAQLSRLPLPVLVDCTSAEGMQHVYQAAFTRGIHVVAANKKPLALPWAEREALMASAKAHSRSYLYETTCGASLPVIETLKNLVRTGDDVRRIEGSLSGTLGYLCESVMRGVPLSEAVAAAQAKGLTEPHPRDDLSGLDVARKALILARELGAPLELGEVAVEPFIDPAALREDDPAAFLKGLRNFDRAFAAKTDLYKRDGLTLRYLAQVVVTDGRLKVRVGPVAVKADHPATHLCGEEAMVAFTTRRFNDYPLIVRGAGAGGEVTAAGVLADILRLAHNVTNR